MNKYETFDTFEEAQSFANSDEEWNYYGISEILDISFSDEWECWVVYYN